MQLQKEEESSKAGEDKCQNKTNDEVHRNLITKSMGETIHFG